MISDSRERIKECASKIRKRAYFLRMNHFDEDGPDYNFGPLDMVRRIEEYAKEIFELSIEPEASDDKSE